MSFILTKWKWSKCILITALFHSAITSAQITQSARLEIPLLEKENQYYNVLSAQKLGLVLYKVINIGKEQKIDVMRVDTTLHEVWRGFIPIENNLTILFAQVNNGVLSFLLKGTNYLSGDFLIVNVSLEKGNFSSYIVKNLIPFQPTQYELTTHAALIGGYFNYRPLIVYFDFTSLQSKVLPGFFNEPGELSQLRTNADGSIDVIVSAKNLERKKCLWIRNYDYQGNLTKTIVLTPEEKKNLIFGRSIQSTNGDQIVSGVYGRYSDYSRGVFVAVVNAMGEYTIRYYNFAELQHFFKYMKASRERRVLNRIERRKIKGKKTKFNYRMMVHDIIPYNNQFIMLGEAFFPHYSYASRSYGSFTYSPRFSANPLSREGLVFDGYQYTHAVVLGFDQNGKLVWDNSFEVNDVRTMQLERFVKMQAEKERIILLYLYENILRSKIIKGAEVLEGKTTGNLEMKFQSDEAKAKETEMSKLDHWYDEYFFAFGVQTIRNNADVRVSQKRKVFFINKITYK